MKAALVIQKAEKLLEQGHQTDAKDLLLNEGFVKRLNPDIQKAYLTLIPESEELLREKKTSLEELFSPNVNKRIKASSYIFKEGRREFAHSRAWLGDPRTIDLLFAALQDKEPKVIENITGALWMISHGGRYNRDLRIYNKLLELVASDHNETVRNAALGLQNYALTSKYQVLLTVLPKQTVAKTVQQILNNFYRGESRAEIEKIRSGLLEIYQSCSRKTIKAEIESTLERLE